MLSLECAQQQFGALASACDGWFEVKKGNRNCFLRVVQSTHLATCGCEEETALHTGILASAQNDNDNTAEEEDVDEHGVVLSIQQQELLVNRKSEPEHIYSYDVCFDAVYRVPVLCFHAEHVECDGSTRAIADIDVVLRDLGHESDGKQQQDWTFVGQTEHPVTGVPCWMLHPCNTKAVMQELVETQDKDQTPCAYLLAWFSLMAPLVKCPVMPLSSIVKDTRN